MTRVQRKILDASIAQMRINGHNGAADEIEAMSDEEKLIIAAGVEATYLAAAELIADKLVKECRLMPIADALAAVREAG